METQLDSFLVAQLTDRYNVARSNIYNRLQGLAIQPEKQGGKSILNADQLASMDALNEHLKTGGTIAKCSTPYGIRGLGTWVAATRQVLGCCAQRLTASEVWEPEGGNLQAFRLWQVLNALRHQRSGNLNIRLNQSSSASCLTPYGIRGLGTAYRN